MPLRPPTRRRSDSPSWHRSPLVRWLRRPLVYWAVVGLLLVVTVVAVSRQADRQRQLTDTYGELREVPVAVAVIRPGEPLDAAAVRWEQRPAAGVPPGTVTGLAEGALAAAAIYPGEVIHRERVAGSGGGLSSRLAPGTAAVTVPASYGLPPLQPGDRVNLIAVVDSFASDTAPEARTVARHATVLELDEDAVTVAVATAEMEPTVAALVWGTVAVIAVPTTPG